MSQTRRVFWKRSLLTAAAVSVTGAAFITALSRPQPLEVKLLTLHAAETAPDLARAMESETPEMQLLLLAYAQNSILVAKARLALERYPDLARTVLLTYGRMPEFQDVLIRHGEDVVLPIHYFLANEVWAAKAQHEIGGLFNKVKTWVSLDKDPVEPGEPVSDLTPEQRGLYAVRALQSKGYNFLGQFREDENGQAAWLQTERAAEAVSGFFTSGLVGLEEKVQTGQQIEVLDVAGAGLDLAIGLGALKIAKLGKGAAKSGQLAVSSTRSSVAGRALLGQSKISARFNKYGRNTALAITSARHPSVFSSILDKIATVYDLSKTFVQWSGWTMALHAVSLLLIFLLRPLFWLLSGAVKLLGWAYRALHGKPLAKASPTPAAST